MLFRLVSTFSNLTSHAYIFVIILALCTLLRSQQCYYIDGTEAPDDSPCPQDSSNSSFHFCCGQKTIGHVLQTRSVTAPVTLRPTLAAAAQIALGYLQPVHISACQVSRLPETFDSSTWIWSYTLHSKPKMTAPFLSARPAFGAVMSMGNPSAIVAGMRLGSSR